MTDHSRLWRENRYVYPVISRRAKGLSIGVNLNPDKVCTFNCIYCQVDRRVEPVTDRVDLGTLIRELNQMCQWAAGGEIWRDPHFADVPEAMRRVNDIAFSGDGEPTAFRDFADMVQVAADAKERHRLKGTRLVVISNASRFHTQAFRRALPILQGSDGEVWAKLDAGSAEHFVKVSRTSVPFKRIVENIGWLATQMPVVIQSCFFILDGSAPGDTEIELYIARLRHILQTGGRLKAVQLYTIARRPAESAAAPLPAARLEALAARLRDVLADVPVEAYPGVE
ncbi:MAG: radical SAM protein [Planctomycetes bacterium]|nr:radical SAM protein [Planctomycetota bacterium]